MTTKTVLVVSDEVAHLLRYIVAIGVLEKYIYFLRIAATEHTLISHIQFLAGVAAETAPEQHHADVALMQHVVVLVLLALARHRCVEVFPFLKVQLKAAPLEQLVEMQHEVRHFLTFW